MNLGILTYCLVGLGLCYALVMSEQDTFRVGYAKNQRLYGRALTDAGLIFLIVLMAIGWPALLIISWFRR